MFRVQVYGDGWFTSQSGLTWDDARAAALDLGARGCTVSLQFADGTLVSNHFAQGDHVAAGRSLRDRICA